MLLDVHADEVDPDAVGGGARPDLPLAVQVVRVRLRVRRRRELPRVVRQEAAAPGNAFGSKIKCTERRIELYCRFC